MAEALSHITECPVCYLTYVNPRLLPCQHSLCAQCVSKIQDGATIKCPMCNTTHDVDKLCADFRLVQIIEALECSALAAPRAPGTAPPCALCRTGQIAFLCAECDTWQCDACKTTHMRNKATKSHHVIPLAAKCQVITAKVARQSSFIRSKVDAQSQSMARIDAAMKQLMSEQTNALQRTDELRQKSISDIKAHFDSLDARIIQFIQTQISHLGEEKRKLIQQVQEINSKRDTLERLVTESAAELAVNGATILDDVTRLSERITDVNLRIDDVDIRVTQDRAWNAATAASLQLNGSVFNGAALATGPSYQPYGQDVFRSNAPLSRIKRKKFTKQNQISLSRAPRALRLINQQLWSCQENGQIEIYNLDLQLERTLSNTDWGQACDVTQVSDRSFVIACSKGLFHVADSGKTISTMERGRHDSAAWRHGKLYACTTVHLNTPPTLLIYSYSNNTWHRLASIPLRTFTHYTCITLCVTNSAIYVCSALDHKVIKMSLAGEKLQTMKSFDRPFLCQADDEDSLLVADRDNNCVKVGPTRGSWSVVPLEPQVEKPRAAVFTSDRLYVLSEHRHRILLYV